MDDMSWGWQKTLVGLLLVGIAFIQVQSWDEEDFAKLRADAERAKVNGVRYLVEESQYRDVYASAFHCRAPRKGERLAMQHANPRDPGKGYRCTYWLTQPRREQLATATWSRSPEVVETIEIPVFGRPQ